MTPAKEPYIFISARLGFRNWLDEDLSAFAEICANDNVMKFFPSTLSTEETHALIRRQQEQFKERGHCYFAVDRLDTGELIGFIGMAYQTYEADFTPCVDIGWRLGPKHWNLGFATEGATACLKYGFNELNIEEIYSVCSTVNVNSSNVMKKIGMQFHDSFIHPALKDIDYLAECVVYKIRKS